MNDEMLLNSYGQIVREEWLRTPSIRQEIDIDEFVVMPNHIHGIVWIEAKQHSTAKVGAHGRAPLQRQPRSLGSFVAGYKSIVTKRINQLRQTPGTPVWQRNYYEHVVRNEDDLYDIRHYIRYNPMKWSDDQYHPR